MSTSTINSSREMESSRRVQNQIWLLIFNGILGFVFGLFNTLSQPYLYALLGSESKVGLVLTIGAFALYLPQFWSGNLSDRIGRKITMGIGLIFMSVAFINLGYLPSMIWILVGIILVNIGYGIHSPAFNVFISENQTHTRTGATFGIMYFGYFIGQIGANFLVQILGESYDYPFYFRLIFFIVLGWLILQSIFLQESNSTRKTSHASHDREIDCSNEKPLAPSELSHVPEPTSTQSIWAIVWHTKLIRNLIIYLTIDGLIWGIVVSIYYSGFVATFGVSKEYIARLALVFSIANMVFQIPAGKLVDRFGSQKTLIWSVSAGFSLFGCVIIAWFMQSRDITIWLIISQISLAFSVALYLPAQVTLSTNFSQHRRAEIFGVINAIKGIGFIPTALLGGLLMEKIHFLAPFIIALCFLPVEIIFLAKALPDPKKNH